MTRSSAHCFLPIELLPIVPAISMSSAHASCLFCLLCQLRPEIVPIVQEPSWQVASIGGAGSGLKQG